jgi:hypothetical protein
LIALFRRLSGEMVNTFSWGRGPGDGVGVFVEAAEVVGAPNARSVRTSVVEHLAAADKAADMVGCIARRTGLRRRGRGFLTVGIQAAQLGLCTW